MPDSSSAATRGRTLYLVAALLAAVALALGLWDLLVERDGGRDWVGQVVLPAGLLALMFWLWVRGARG